MSIEDGDVITPDNPRQYSFVFDKVVGIDNDNDKLGTIKVIVGDGENFVIKSGLFYYSSLPEFHYQ